MRSVIKLFLILGMGAITHELHAQLLEGSLFRIYRAEFILGTVTQFKLASDGSYSVEIIEIHCSLCDHNELKERINSKGTWTQTGDTIVVDNGKRFLPVNDALIRPLFVMGIDLDSVPVGGESVHHRLPNGNTQDFHLVYDTYPNGVAKFIVDKHRMKSDEYEIELNPDGTINSVKYFRDGKPTKRLR